MPCRHRSNVVAAALISTLALLAGLAASVHAGSQEASPPAIVSGTWTGTSTCTGDRPACRNEIVVYRFEAIPGRGDGVRLYADKIVDGKRLPMGALDCEVDVAKASVRCEFQRRQTHGIWEYKLDGDAMSGRLVLLPDESIGRDVKVRRVKDVEVPSAPPASDYAE